MKPETLHKELEAQKDLDVIFKILVEVARARGLHPESELLSLAFTEEAGEVIKALLDHREGKPGATMLEFRKECIQAAAMAVRLYQEGDPAVVKS